MAGYNNGNRVCPVGKTNRTTGCGMTNSTSYFSIGSSFTIRNIEQSFPYPALKLGATYIQGYAELTKFSLEVSIKFSGYLLVVYVVFLELYILSSPAGNMRDFLFRWFYADNPFL
jgi:hypothetical protein